MILQTLRSYYVLASLANEIIPTGDHHLKFVPLGTVGAAHIVHKGISWPTLSIAIAVPSRLRDSVLYHGTRRGNRGRNWLRVFDQQWNHKLERLNLFPKAVNIHLFLAQNSVEVGHVSAPLAGNTGRILDSVATEVKQNGTRPSKTSWTGTLPSVEEIAQRERHVNGMVVAAGI
jgi:hypothetical protein